MKQITVDLHLTKKPGNLVAAVADVLLDLADVGSIKISGFRVMLPDGKPAWVAPPARQGEKTWFDVIGLKGPLKRLVEGAVLKEYERVKASTSRQ